MAGSASGSRYIDLAISVQVADVERDASDRPRWVEGSHEQLEQIGGRWDRKRKRWVAGAAPGAILPIIFHRGQEDAARWFVEWLRRYVSGNWKNYKRAWSVLLIGGRRSGKTHIACAALVLFAVLNPKALIWAVSPTLETGGELEDALKSITPRRWYTCKRAKHGRSVVYRFANGSRILLKSGIKPERLKAGRVDLALLNEAQEMSQRAYVKLRAPIADRGGLVIVTANPPETIVGRWVEDYYNAAHAGSIDAAVFDLDPEKNPWIKHEALTSMAREIDQETYDRDVRGLFPPIGDIVFFAWSDRESKRAVPEGFVNVTRDFTKRHLGRSFDTVAGIDLQQTPHMCAAIIEFYEDPVEPGETLAWVVDEVVVDEADEDDLIDGLERAGFDAETTAVVMDASAWWQDGAHHKGKTSDRKFRARGWSNLYRPQKDSDRNPDIVERVKTTNGRLKSATVPATAEHPAIQGRRRLFVVPNCDRVCKAMRNWEKRNGIPNRRSDYAHIGDAVSYPVFRFFAAPKVKKKRGEYRGVGRFDRGDSYPRA
jgi:hypothetical protein